METIECKHKTEIRPLSHGIEVEECTICHQKVQKNTLKPSVRPTVVQLGRIDGKIVLPSNRYALSLLPRDQADLAAARQAVGEVHRFVPPFQNHTESPGQQPKEPVERLRWYKENKNQMIDDLITLGKEGFLEKWGKLGVKPQIISHLKTDPYYLKKKREAPMRKILSPASTPGSKPGDKVPPLPPWSDNWAPEVQVKWLEVYEKLIEIGE